MASECPKKTGVTCFVCKKIGHVSTNCPQRMNVSSGPSQSKGNIGNPGPNTSKNTGPARVYAMYGEPMETEDYVVDEDDNVWMNSDIDEIGLIAGKYLLFMIIVHTHT